MRSVKQLSNTKVDKFPKRPTPAEIFLFSRAVARLTVSGTLAAAPLFTRPHLRLWVASMRARERGGSVGSPVKGKTAPAPKRPVYSDPPGAPDGTGAGRAQIPLNRRPIQSATTHEPTARTPTLPQIFAGGWSGKREAAIVISGGRFGRKKRDNDRNFGQSLSRKSRSKKFRGECDCFIWFVMASSYVCNQRGW